MTSHEETFELSSKLDNLLATMSKIYASQKNSLLELIVVNGKPTLEEAREYDNWNGGIYGHALTLALPEEVFIQIINDKASLESQIREDIEKLHDMNREYICKVFFEMEPSQGERWREDSGVLHPRSPSARSEVDSTRIWGDKRIRLFLSHKATFKEQTFNLKKSLAPYGIAAFVAHSDIEPTDEWLREVERALFSMDVLVALLSEDFHDSNWTDQEVGVAIGRRIPIVSIRLGRDPYGFMGKQQGLSGCQWEDTSRMSLNIFELLLKKELIDKRQLFTAALSAYADSTSWADSVWKVKNVLSKFESLTPSQVHQLLKVYQVNKQNFYSFEGNDYLLPLLNKWTGKHCEDVKDYLVPSGDNTSTDNEIPF